ncbi:Serpentine receptor class gamma, partial [Trichostrongylus colubriformis]
IWSSHFGKILILSQLVPLIFTWFVLPCRSFAQLDKPDGGLEIEYEKIFTLSASLHSAIAATIFGLLTFFATIVIIIKLLCSNLKRLSSAEKTMFAFEVFLALTTLMYATTQALLYSSKYLFKDPGMQRAVRISRNFIIDIFILPNAWTLPLLSHSVRRYHAKSILRLVGKSTNIARSSNVTQRLPLRRVK